MDFIGAARGFMANSIALGLCGNGVVGTNIASPCSLCSPRVTAFSRSSICGRTSTAKFVGLCNLPAGMCTGVGRGGGVGWG